MYYGRKIVLVLFAIFITANCSATHIIGGEITYRNLGSNNYQVTLKLYRDCINGIAAFDDPAHVSIYNSTGGLITILNMPFPGSSVLPIITGNPCLIPPSNICVEEAIYVSLINLPPIAGGYDLVYQRCCRNGTISNISSPGTFGSSYLAHIPGITNANNNSPRYNTFPLIFICANSPLNFNHSATDLDGDSLVYSLCSPYEGASQFDPMPFQPSAPPFNTIPYVAPFSSAFPLPSSPAININPQTGILTGTPNAIGQFVVAVCVSEYRNGVLLSVNKRDFQFNVTNCPNAIASIPNQQVFCDGFTVQFSNTSVNATNYIWDFGVNGITTDVSNMFAPSYTYPDSGIYTIRLVAYTVNTNCVDTAFKTFRVYPLLQPDFVIPPSQCFQGNSYNFTAGGAYTVDAKFLWNFGNEANIKTSTLMSPTGIHFTSDTSQTVSLTISQYGCTETVTKLLSIFKEPTSIISTTTQYCAGLDVNFNGTSTLSNAYEWNFGDPSTILDTSTLLSPHYLYPDTGIFRVMLAVSNNNGLCRDTSYLDFYVYPLIVPNFVKPQNQCLRGNTFNFNGGGIYTSQALFNWNFGSSATPLTSTKLQPANVSFSNAGKKIISYTIQQFGCSKTYLDSIEVYTMPVSIITPQTDLCSGLNYRFSHISSNFTSVFWDFGQTTTFNDTSSLAAPLFVYADSGRYKVSLIAMNQGGLCKDTSTQFFQFYHPILPEILPVTDECIEGNSFDFFASGSFYTNATFSWNFGPTALPQISSISKNPSGISFPVVGTYPITLTVTQFTCSESIIRNANVVAMPIASIVSQNLFCNGYTFNFSNNSTNANQYFWDFGDNTSMADFSANMNPSYTYPDSGLFKVTLVAMNNGGRCKDTISANFKIHSLLLPMLSEVAPQCVIGNNYDLEAKGSFSSLASFFWSFTGPASIVTSTLQNINGLTYADAGLNTASLTISENGCTRTTSAPIETFPELKIDFSVGSPEGCNPYTVEILDKSFAKSELFYLWDFGDGATSTEKNPTHSFATGVYDLKLRIHTTRGCIDTLFLLKPKYITVIERPVVGLRINPEETSIFEPKVQFKDVSKNAVACKLVLGDGTEIDSCNFNHIYKEPGEYSVMQIVTNRLNCTDTLRGIVRITPEFRCWIPNSFTPNGDYLNDVFMPVTYGVAAFDLQIFDRWGTRIFSSSKASIGWEGKVNNDGAIVQEDVYIYKLNIRSVLDKDYTFFGKVSLIR